MFFVYKFNRFQYHFVSKRPTNRLEKPEWYFIQILKWCKSVHTFVEKTFQSAVVKAGKLDFNIGVSCCLLIILQSQCLLGKILLIFSWISYKAWCNWPYIN